MINLLYSVVAILAATGTLVDPPEIEWTTEFGTRFWDVHETSGGNFVVGGTKYYSTYRRCVFLYDTDGEMIWEAGVPDITFSEAHWVEETNDGGYAAAGVARSHPDSTLGFLLAGFDNGGNYLWSKIYDLPNSRDEAFCVTPLPDGGFAACGRTNGEGLYIGDAWIMRLDEVGDTLWTDVWGEYTANYARSILLVDNTLKVLTYGRIHPDSSRGPHLLTYDMDGNLLSENRIQELGGDECLDMCYSPADGGYTLTTHYNPRIAHTDSLGNLEWTSGVPAISQPFGWSINRTMEGGYIFGGQNTPDPDQPWTEYFGVISRYYPCGTLMWWDHIYEGDCMCIYSIRQLSEGGYIAAGKTLNLTGVIIKYAPETGVEEGSGMPEETLLGTVHPNPSAGRFQIPVLLTESLEARIEVYDITGRRVGLLWEGLLPAGEHGFEWEAPGMPDGCYLVRLSGAGVSETARCVLVR